jgi:hypothetical protein
VTLNPPACWTSYPPPKTIAQRQLRIAARCITDLAPLAVDSTECCGFDLQNAFGRVLEIMRALHEPEWGDDDDWVRAQALGLMIHFRRKAAKLVATNLKAIDRVSGALARDGELGQEAIDALISGDQVA